MGADIEGSGSGSGGVGSSFKITLDWDETTPPSGVSYTTTTNAKDTVSIYHGLGTRDVIVDVLDLQATADNLNNNPYDGLDIGHSGHVIVTRDTDNTVKLLFGSANDTGFEYRVLVQKIG